MPSLPIALETAIQSAVTQLQTRLRCTALEAPSHNVVLVEGWGDDDALEAAAVYLVGLFASAISTTLQVRAQITGTAADRLELVDNVASRVGSPTKTLDDDQKARERNPWLAEGLWHLCLFLAQTRTDFHPVGAIAALQPPHISPKDHGFDVFALYRDGDTFGVTFVESKAYESDPNAAIKDSVAFFEAIDAGRHDMRIRQSVAGMRDALPADVQKLFSPSLWKDSRTYIPNPHYDNALTMNWQNNRPSLSGLRVVKDRILIMPHPIKGFATFFDTLSVKMLAFATSVSSV